LRKSFPGWNRSFSIQESNDGETPSEPSKEKLIALIAAQRSEFSTLKVRIAELEHQFGLDSSNSGTPPSTNRLKKPARVKSLRERCASKPGEQKSHKGETQQQLIDPDEVVVITHRPARRAARASIRKRGSP
jgi:hypothetical protein